MTRRASFDQRCPVRQSRTGGRGRIRTSVARKERQIYSLLVLATHPPVLEKTGRAPTASFNSRLLEKVLPHRIKTQKGLVSKDTSPSISKLPGFATLHSLRTLWWSWRRELNPRPSDYKSDALPAELRQRSETDQG